MIGETHSKGNVRPRPSLTDVAVRASVSFGFTPLVVAQALIVPYVIFVYWLIEVGCTWN